jgi:hypothetical protein
LVSNSLSAHGPVEAVAQAEAPHLARFVDASGNSLGGLLKGLLRQFMQQNGGTNDQNSLLNIGKLILNAVLPFLSNTGGFDSGLAINDLQKIINSLLNEKQTAPNGSGGLVQLAAGSYSVKFTDDAGKTREGTIAIAPGTTPAPQPAGSGGGVQLAPSSYAVKFTDDTGKTRQGTITIGPGNQVLPDPRPIPTPNSDASNQEDRGVPAPNPPF